MKKYLSGVALLSFSLILARSAFAGSITGEVKFIDEPPKMPRR